VLRAVRELLSAVRQGRFPHGVTLVEVDRWTIAEELWSFGEDALYSAPLEMSDEQLVRVWVLAGRLYEQDEARSAPEAAALATVSVIEGERRPLRRKRRRPQAQRVRFEQTTEERMGRRASNRGRRRLPGNLALTRLVRGSTGAVGTYDANAE